MPMFHDPDRCLAAAASGPDRPLNSSEESVRTEFCDGPLLADDGPVPAPAAARSAVTSDRAELMRRIKRGESPTWVPNRKLEHLYRESHSPSPPKNAEIALSNRGSPLLPAIELGGDRPGRCEYKLPSHPAVERESDPSPPPEIERPRSALHSGDFTEDRRNPVLAARQPHAPRSDQRRCTSPPAPWALPGSHADPCGPGERELDSRGSVPMMPGRGSSRSRAPSLHSFSSSFVLKPPTSPLVQQSNQEDLDFSPLELSGSASRTCRRHTLNPQILQNLDPLQNGRYPHIAHAAYQPVPLQKDGFSNSQARRSLTSNLSFHGPSSPQTPPPLRSRRQSFCSDVSPLQHASMVGSFEESILRGRMSTLPSKPIDFVAKIGALGKGDCKPKFPAHVTLPFQAVYYNWNSGAGRNHGIIDDEPSPYVADIDLEQLLSAPAPQRQKDQRRKHKDVVRSDQCGTSSKPDGASEHLDLPTKVRDKRRQRSASPMLKAPPGGSYRIPQQGHLQIIIKNSNKTAVKLFIVPYDLTGMEPGTKTFIRQKIYSSGPIIESPIGSTAFGWDGRTKMAAANRKSSLRYLIHLNICCPAKGRFFLYQRLRVVFANRVPDNKEHLENDTQLGGYSPYKPNRDTQTASSIAAVRLMADKAQRRRSYGYGTSLSQLKTPRGEDGRFGSSTLFPASTHGATTPPVPSLPFDLLQSRRATWQADEEPPMHGKICAGHDAMDVDGFGFARPMNPRCQPLIYTPPRTTNPHHAIYSPYSTSSTSISGSGGSEGYSKLNRGDVGYGGVFRRPGTPEPGEGLLARRLRGLGMEKDGEEGS